MESGLGLEKQILTPVEAEPFFLTSLFIELMDTDFGEGKAQACDNTCFQQLRVRAAQDWLNCLRVDRLEVAVEGASQRIVEPFLVGLVERLRQVLAKTEGHLALRVRTGGPFAFKR